MGVDLGEFHSRTAKHSLIRVRRVEALWVSRGSSAGRQFLLMLASRLGLAASRGRRSGQPLSRQDRLIALILRSYRADLGKLARFEERSASRRDEFSQLTQQLEVLDEKASALRASVVRVLRMNSELDRSLHQERAHIERLDRARLAALQWVDSLRAELEHRSAALACANETIAQMASVKVSAVPSDVAVNSGD